MPKSSIFDKSFDEIFTKERLAFEASKLQLPPPEDNFFSFAPHISFALPKEDGDTRIISIPDAKAKIIQKILYEELSTHLKFSDRSYAYQKGKSPIKAINRAKALLQTHEFVIKSDIDSFFDSIDHDRLYHKLQKIVKDPKILYLIALFLKNGSLFKGQWQDKLEGVYQGDVLSPLLSNIYLHSFDISLQKREIEFLRYADDIILFGRTFEEAKSHLRFVSQRLAIEKLRLKESKTAIIHRSKPFTYLGVRFDIKNEGFGIDNDRLMQKISKLSKETKNLDLPQAVDKINEHIRDFLAYYGRILTDTSQLQLLQKRVDEIVVQKIVQAKLSKKITRKAQFFEIVRPLLSYHPSPNYPNRLVHEAYERLKLLTPQKSAIKQVQSQKRAYLKNYLKITELIVTKTGSHLYYSMGKIKIRTKDEPIKQIPFNRVKRIILTTTRASISVYLIKECAKAGIDIDFIDQNHPYALLTFHKSISQQLHLKQLKMILSPKALTYAKALHYAKAKNQRNLLKYFSYRHRHEKLEIIIQKIDSLITKIDQIKESKSLMGLEGQISQLYWNGFALITHLSHFQRTHKDSQDPINQALNYGYAILYNRIQSLAIKEGLNIYYSFLHSTDYKKPTLVFDLIEPFRQPIVDREIISILTKNQKIEQKDGKLSAKSKKLIVQNIQERLASPTKTKYGKTTYQNLLGFEINAFKRAIEEEKPRHKFFIAKY